MSIADNIHYFTATRKLSVSDDGLGMNNTAVFGEVIYQKTPREMIELGFMVQPRFHIVKAKQDTNKAVSVLEAFREHDLIIREHNADTTGKMLVCCNGTKPVEEIRNSSYIQQAIKNEDITVFSITSEFGCHINNVAYQNRDEFLKILRAHKGKAIVLHVNILTEGIDIPDMSGVLYLRDMTICRFGQSQGRSTRPLAEDLPLPINLRKKQFSYVIVVEYEDDLGSRDHSANIIDMMYNMRELGFNPEEIEVLGQDIGMNVDSEIEDTNQKTRRAYQIGSGADILGHVIEAEGLARLVTDPVEVLDAWLSEE
jgi:superfamily II DNA or RNA helicase